MLLLQRRVGIDSPKKKTENAEGIFDVIISLYNA